MAFWLLKAACWRMWLNGLECNRVYRLIGFFRGRMYFGKNADRVITACKYTCLCDMVAFFVNIFCGCAFRTVPDDPKRLKFMAVRFYNITVIDYGILASKSCLLTDVADQLHESSKKINVVDRLSRHLEKGTPASAFCYHHSRGPYKRLPFQRVPLPVPWTGM